jgi:hypothetical protein
MKRIFERQSAFVKTSLICITLMFLLCATRSWAETYTGILKYGDGLKGATAWKSSILKWTVDDNTHPGLWTYAYSFTVKEKEISHVIIEVAEGFKQQNLRGDTTPKYELGTFGHKGNSTPGIPGDIRGMKWETSGKALNYSWVIVTDRAPMWGDFYAKDGKQKDDKDGKYQDDKDCKNKDDKDCKQKDDWVFSYNKGFGSDPVDPTIREGNNGGWVLVPGMMTYHENAVSNFALNAFKRIRSLVDPKDETIPRPEFIDNHIEVTSESWAYVLDNTGQIFRPKATYPHLKESFQHDIGQDLPGWIHVPVDLARIDKAKEFSLSMVGVEYLKNVKVTPGRELIASKRSDSKTIDRHYEGRTVVMFTPPTPPDQMIKGYSTAMTYAPDGHTIAQTTPIDLPRKGYETAVTFSPSGNLMRIESAFLAPEVRRIIAVFSEGLKMGAIKGRLYYDPDIRYGSFFNPDGWQFESTAFSFEGQDFVTNNEPCCYDAAGPCNPYYQDLFLEVEPCYDPIVPNFSDLWTMPYYRYDYWQWWHNTGRTNGIRGNNICSEPCLYPVWKIPGYDAVGHKNLKDYKLTNLDPNLEEEWGFPHCDTDAKHPDGIVAHLEAGGLKLEQQFYDDLEGNHVAMFSTHGGVAVCKKDRNNDFYQFLQEGAHWVKLHWEGDPGLGHGNLRHLFLATCSSMGWNHGPKHGEMANLAPDWMNKHVADGIRTICGADGEARGAHMSGLEFFGYYHKGESISQAWSNMALDECTCNMPVTVAYGSTEDEAASILFDGRFTKDRGNKGWVIAAELITEHLATHQACCVAGSCKDVPLEECEGTPKGIDSQCSTFVFPTQNNSCQQDNGLCVR